MITYVKTVKKNLQNLEAAKKTYAVAQAQTTIEITDLAEHMATHQTPFSKGTIAAVITDMVSCMREKLLNGCNIHLGDLGNFCVKLKSKGVCESVADEETGEKPVFGVDDITAVRTHWTPGASFSNLLQDATFEETITLDAKAASLKAKSEAIAAGTYSGSSSSSSSSGTSGNPVQE